MLHKRHIGLNQRAGTFCSANLPGVERAHVIERACMLELPPDGTAISLNCFNVTPSDADRRRQSRLSHLIRGLLRCGMAFGVGADAPDVAQLIEADIRAGRDSDACGSNWRTIPELRADGYREVYIRNPGWRSRAPVAWFPWLARPAM